MVNEIGGIALSLGDFGKTLLKSIPLATGSHFRGRPVDDARQPGSGSGSCRLSGALRLTIARLPAALASRSRRSSLSRSKHRLSHVRLQRHRFVDAVLQGDMLTFRQASRIVLKRSKELMDFFISKGPTV